MKAAEVEAERHGGGPLCERRLIERDDRLEAGESACEKLAHDVDGSWRAARASAMEALRG